MNTEESLAGAPAQHLGAVSREPDLGNGDDEDNNALEFASSAEAEAAEMAEEHGYDTELPSDVLNAVHEPGKACVESGS